MTEKLKKAQEIMQEINLFKNLQEYNPTLCGTIPIGIDIIGSDLDIIMEVHDFTNFEKKVTNLYGHYHQFRWKRLVIRNVPVIKANFTYKNFEFELFGQTVPVNKQYAYLHMIIEREILHNNPELKHKIVELKKLGMKTEPAFCKVLGLQGDPYEALIQYGIENGLVKGR